MYDRAGSDCVVMCNLINKYFLLIDCSNFHIIEADM